MRVPSDSVFMSDTRQLFEKEVEQLLTEAGWKTLHNGWPDFLCWREEPDGSREVMCVEVKDEKTNDKLRETQITNHLILHSIGVPIHVVKKAGDLQQLDSVTSVQVIVQDALQLFERLKIRYVEALTKVGADHRAAREKMFRNVTETFDAKFESLFQKADSAINSFSTIQKLLSGEAEEDEEPASESADEKRSLCIAKSSGMWQYTVRGRRFINPKPCKKFAQPGSQWCTQHAKLAERLGIPLPTPPITDEALKELVA